MTTQTAQLINRLEGLAGRRGPSGSRIPRGRDLLLRLADHAPASSSEDAARLLHAVLSAVKRKAITEAFAARLLDRMLPKAVAQRPRPTVILDLPAITDAASYAEAQAGVLRALGAGEISPAEGKTISGVLAQTWEAVRVAERYHWLAALQL